MKLPFVFGPGDLRVVDVATPNAGPRDVLVRVGTTGVCGTDLSYVAAGEVGAAPKPFPLGHELCGTVIEAGGEVTTHKRGDRVILNPLFNMIGNGGPEGGFAELLLVRDVATNPEALLSVPPTMSFDKGALVEPVAVALHAVNRSGAAPGEKVALFGAGPIGLGVILGLRQRGIDDIVVFEPSTFRRERALRLGARVALDPRETAVREALAELHGEAAAWGGYPAVATDLYIEASGARGLIGEIARDAMLGARLTVVAVHHEPVELDFINLMAREMTIITSMGYPSELADAIALLSSDSVDSDALVSHRFAAAEVEQAFAAAARAESSAKVLVQYNAEPAD